MLILGFDLESGSKIFSQCFHVNIWVLYPMKLHDGILTTLSIFI